MLKIVMRPVPIIFPRGRLFRLNTHVEGIPPHHIKEKSGKEIYKPNFPVHQMPSLIKRGPWKPQSFPSRFQ